jgi:hypothetical protein
MKFRLLLMNIFVKCQPDIFIVMITGSELTHYGPAKLGSERVRIG